VVYLVGSLRLATATGMSLETGLVEGAVVFLPGDLAKAVAVMLLITGGHLLQAREFA
jgi:biotin transporter BioY